MLQTWHDWQSPQLVTIAVYVYFYFVSIFSSQLLKPTANTQITVDFPFPFFTVLKFIFYFGWLRIAEALINPFGEDDDDFDINFILDRNIQIRYIYNWNFYWNCFCQFLSLLQVDEEEEESYSHEEDDVTLLPARFGWAVVFPGTSETNRKTLIIYLEKIQKYSVNKNNLW